MPHDFACPVRIRSQFRIVRRCSRTHTRTDTHKRHPRQKPICGLHMVHSRAPTLLRSCAAPPWKSRATKADGVAAEARAGADTAEVATEGTADADSAKAMESPDRLLPVSAIPEASGPSSRDKGRLSRLPPTPSGLTRWWLKRRLPWNRQKPPRDKPRLPRMPPAPSCLTRWWA